MRMWVIIVAAVFVASCSNGYQKFYKPDNQMDGVPFVERLVPGEEPEIIRIDDLILDLSKLNSKHVYAM